MTTTRGPQGHDSRREAETGLQEKGLRAASVGMVGGMVLGIFRLRVGLGLALVEDTPAFVVED